MFAGLYCPGLFDGWVCWPDTAAGESATHPCPEFIVGFDPERKYLCAIFFQIKAYKKVSKKKLYKINKNIQRFLFEHKSVTEENKDSRVIFVDCNIQHQPKSFYLVFIALKKILFDVINFLHLNSQTIPWEKILTWKTDHFHIILFYLS